MPLSLDDIMKNEKHYTAFKKFLESEFSAESLLFLKDVKVMNSLSGTKKQPKIQFIITNYIQADSPSEININGKTRAQLLATWTQTPNMPANSFDAAVNEIRVLLTQDPLPRFLQSYKPK